MQVDFDSIVEERRRKPNCGVNTSYQQSDVMDLEQ